MTRFIDRSLIDLDDETFRISTNRQTSFLTESVARFGVIVPVLLQPVGSRYRPVCGFSRLTAAAAAGVEKISARVIDPDHHDNRDCACFAVADNAFGRGLEPAEEIRGVRLLSEFMVPDEIADLSRDLFNKPMNAAHVARLLDIGKMPAGALTAIEEGGLSITAALRLRSLSQSSIEAFIDVFRKVTMSLNKQLEVITQIQEIAARESIGVDELFGSDDLGAIMADPDIPGPRKTALLREWLNQRRFPELSRYRLEFDKTIQDLKLGSRIRLEPERNFESGTMTAQVRFSTADQLRRSASDLLSLSENPILNRLLQ